MCRRLVLVLAALASVVLIHEQNAEPCGVKLNIKAPRVKKQFDHSSNPSQILLLGDPPRALSKELIGRGHKVEVASNADEARRVKYHAIVADPDHEEEAKSRWPGALIIVRHGNAKADANLVDHELGASPTRTLVARTPQRTSRDERAPIRTGPQREDSRGGPVAAGGDDASSEATEARSLEASGGGSESPSTTAAATPAPPDKATRGSDEEAPPRPATRVAAASIDARASTERESAGEPVVKVPGRFSRHIFFSNSSASLSARAQAKLTRNAMWLQRHGDRNVVVEGHASTTGALAANQKLSEARAKAVKDFLIEQGVDESRIESVGFGMSKPEFKPGSNPRNRRVVVKVEH